VETFRNELLLEVKTLTSTGADSARSAVQLTSAALHRTKNAAMVRQASYHTHRLLSEGISPVNGSGFTPLAGPMASVQRLAPRLNQPRGTREAALDRDFSFRVPKDAKLMIPKPSKDAHQEHLQKLSLVDTML
jgi:hypothetical protein